MYNKMVAQLAQTCGLLATDARCFKSVLGRKFQHVLVDAESIQVSNVIAGFAVKKDCDLTINEKFRIPRRARLFLNPASSRDKPSHCNLCVPGRTQLFEPE